MRACWLKWVGRDWSISADYIWLNYSDANIGKKNGFKCLIYMHRYQPDLLVRVRTNYVHEQQERYRTQLAHLEEAVAQVDISQRVKLNKQIKKLNDQLAETITFGEKIHHLAEQMIAIGLRDKRDRFRHLYH